VQRGKAPGERLQEARRVLAIDPEEGDDLPDVK
jgi:hypothetical protein